MAGTPIEKLRLSARASNVLHRIGIHFVEALTATPMEEISKHRNIGAKTLEVDLNALDRRLVNLSMFGSVLYKKKQKKHYFVAG